MLYADTSKQALTRWLQARGDRLFPRTTELGPFEMKPFLPFTAMVRREPGPIYRLTVVGTALVEVFGADATGQEVKTIYPAAEHALLEEFYATMFSHHYLSQSLRVFEKSAGLSILIEQFLMPIGNPDGEHDRYMVTINRLPMPETNVSGPRPELLIGELQRRTVYDPATLLPVDCPLTTERGEKEMATPLVNLSAIDLMADLPDAATS
jgi:hypothetical protein